jgi:hypothetical protein
LLLLCDPLLFTVLRCRPDLLLLRL